MFKKYFYILKVCLIAICLLLIVYSIYMNYGHKDIKQQNILLNNITKIRLQREGSTTYYNIEDSNTIKKLVNILSRIELGRKHLENSKGWIFRLTLYEENSISEYVLNNGLTTIDQIQYSSNNHKIIEEIRPIFEAVKIQE